MFVQYKSKQNKLKVLSYTDFVFNAYMIIYAGSVFLGTPCIFGKAVVMDQSFTLVIKLSKVSSNICNTIFSTFEAR